MCKFSWTRSISYFHSFGMFLFVLCFIYLTGFCILVSFIRLVLVSVFHSLASFCFLVLFIYLLGMVLYFFHLASSIVLFSVCLIYISGFWFLASFSWLGPVSNLVPLACFCFLVLFGHFLCTMFLSASSHLPLYSFLFPCSSCPVPAVIFPTDYSVVKHVLYNVWWPVPSCKTYAAFLPGNPLPPPRPPIPPFPVLW